MERKVADFGSDKIFLLGLVDRGRLSEDLKEAVAGEFTMVAVLSA